MRKTWNNLMFLALGGCLVLTQVGRADNAAKNKGSADQEFVQKAAGAGLAEVNLSQLALQMGSTAEVKQFAQSMVADHSQANKELLAIVDKKGLTVPSEMDRKHKEAMDQLAKKNGSDFDHEYVAKMLDDHKEAVQLFENEAKNGKDEDLKAFASKTLPTIKHHLEMAEKLLGPSKTSK